MNQYKRFSRLIEQERYILRSLDGPERFSQEWHQQQLTEELGLLHTLPARRAVTEERIAWHRWSLSEF
jgi:hypothetical protein